MSKRIAKRPLAHRVSERLGLPPPVKKILPPGKRGPKPLSPKERAKRNREKKIQAVIRQRLEKGLLIVEEGKLQRPVPPSPQEREQRAADAQRASALKWQRKTSGTIRDIGPLPCLPENAIEGFGGGVPLDRYGKPRDPKSRPEGINWELRLACKFDLRLFDETYLKPLFYFDWSADQLRCISKAERVFLDSGKFAMAMPRAGGKTAICRGAVLWGTAYGHKRFPYFIGATDDKSLQTLQFVKTHWYQNKALQRDFPEIGYAIWKLDNRWHLAKGQLFNQEPTYVEWGSDSIRYPCCILPKEIAEWYQTFDPDSVKFIESQNVWVAKTAGIPFACSGIDGSVRGEALTHPVTLEQPRPDVVLLDDVQKDSKADSPIMCGKMINLIDGAIQGMFPPGSSASVLMPCTVIREGDVSDTYLNRTLRPEYQGERCQMVTSWPEGITDYEITDDSDAGKLWNEYAEIRRVSLRADGHFKPATEFYTLHRAVMDGEEWGEGDLSKPPASEQRSETGDDSAAGPPNSAPEPPRKVRAKKKQESEARPKPRPFTCSWSQRFDPKVELSAQQHAMNLRLSLGAMFLSEYQNIGRKLVAEGDMLITAAQLTTKTINTPQRKLPASVQHLCAFVDIQDEILFWSAFGCDPDFTGVFPDYGTWPEVKIPFFTKDNTQTWSMVTQRFFEAFPQHKSKAISNSRGKIRAPLEAKVYWALGQLVPQLLAQEYTREDGRVMKIEKLAIDTRWGQASDSIKRYIRECGFPQVVPYFGHAFPPTNRQLEEYELRDGWYFEHQKNPQVREPKWVIRPNAGDQTWYMQADVSRLKDFLFQRLGSPPGSPGCISLFKAPAERHELFAQHLCNSEYPEPVAARNIIKNQWTAREGSAFDNDWLDCAVGCMALASYLGASLKTVEGQIEPARRSFSQMRQSKQAQSSATFVEQAVQPSRHAGRPTTSDRGIPRVPVSRARSR